MTNMCTECVGSISEEDDKIADYSVKGPVACKTKKNISI